MNLLWYVVNTAPDGALKSRVSEIWCGTRVCLCVCWSVTTISCAETDEPIEVPFGTLVCGHVRPKEPCIRWEPGSSRKRGNFSADNSQPTVR